MKNTKLFWSLIGIISCSCWGISGVFAKELFKASHGQVSSLVLTQSRLIVSGIIVLIIAQLTKKQPIRMVKKWSNFWLVFLYGLLGLMANQLFYFLTIQYGNAAIATILQFLNPFFIMIYMAIFAHEHLRRIEIINAIIAFFGVIMIVTNGHFNYLTLSVPVLFFGILSALGAMACSLLPRPLLTKHFSSIEITGWGLLLGGIALCLLHPQVPRIHLNYAVIFWFVLIVIVGTIIPFIAYTEALKHVSPTILGLLDACEPLMATIGSMVLMNLHLTTAMSLGSLIIIIAVVGLSYQPKSKRLSSNAK